MKDGLGDIWEATQEALLEAIPVYDKGNRVISLGQDVKYRCRGILAAVKSGDAVLDLGCGPGTMSRILTDNIQDIPCLVLADPLRPMLQVAKTYSKLYDSAFVNGLFENLPFRDGVFDVVMCGFSLRDARNYKVAVAEIARILKREGGRLLIVDIGKPDNPVKRWLIGMYLRFAAGLLASLFLGRRGFVFSRIYPTYTRYPSVSEMKDLLTERFEDVVIETGMLGGVMIAVASSPRSSGG